jgi:16S rRNA (cytidine1402-2'-O)-methyltransferase
MSAAIPDRQIVVGRELTKKFEEFWRGPASKVAQSTKAKILKGEFVVLIAPASLGMNGPATEIQQP